MNRPLIPVSAQYSTDKITAFKVLLQEILKKMTDFSLLKNLIHLFHLHALACDNTLQFLPWIHSSAFICRFDTLLLYGNRSSDRIPDALCGPSSEMPPFGHYLNAVTRDCKMAVFQQLVLYTLRRLRASIKAVFEKLIEF